MKYLGPPTHDDYNSLRNLAANMNVNSFPLLRTVLSQIEGQYRIYENSGGDAWQIDPLLTLPEGLPKALRTHYETKPGDLTVINLIRANGSPDVCPMCGSLKSNEIDHVAPKETYPEYSFFTRNLVPACDCNRLKRLSFKGTRYGERVLNPYYDLVLREPLVHVEFFNDFDNPDVRLTVAYDYSTDLAVNYHVDKIVRKTNILGWAGIKWAAIRRKPESVFPNLRMFPNQITSEIVSNVIALHLQDKDEEFGTPNNWYSMVFRGLSLSPGVVNYIANRVNGLRREMLFPD